MPGKCFNKISDVAVASDRNDFNPCQLSASCLMFGNIAIKQIRKEVIMRLASGGVQHETNTFSTTPTTLADFIRYSQLGPQWGNAIVSDILAQAPLRWFL